MHRICKEKISHVFCPMQTKEQIFFFFTPCMMLMQWTGQKLHGARPAMFACTGVAFQSVPMHLCYLVPKVLLVSSGTFFYFFRLRCVNE